MRNLLLTCLLFAGCVENHGPQVQQQQQQQQQQREPTQVLPQPSYPRAVPYTEPIVNIDVNNTEVNRPKPGGHDGGHEPRHEPGHDGGHDEHHPDHGPEHHNA